VDRPRDLLAYEGAFKIRTTEGFREPDELETLEVAASIDPGFLVARYFRWFSTRDEMLAAYGRDRSGGEHRRRLRQVASDRLLRASRSEALVAVDDLARAWEDTPYANDRLGQARTMDRDIVVFELRRVVVPAAEALHDPVAFFNRAVYEIDPQFTSATREGSFSLLVAKRLEIWGPRALLSERLCERVNDTATVRDIVAALRAPFCFRAASPGRPRGAWQPLLNAYEDVLREETSIRPRGAVARATERVARDFGLNLETVSSRLKRAKNRPLRAPRA
jgi:hypothetical protein